MRNRLVTVFGVLIVSLALFNACNAVPPSIEKVTPAAGLPWQTRQPKGPMLSVATFVPTPTPTPAPISTNNAQQVSMVRRIGKGLLTDWAYSPDKSLLAIASSIGVWIYDTYTYVEKFAFHAPGEYFLTVAFSPDGKMIAGGTHDGNVAIWSLSSGDLITTFRAHPPLWGYYRDDELPLAFSADSRMLAVSGGNGSVLIWDLDSGEMLSELRGHDGHINDLAFSPTENILVVTSGWIPGAVHIWAIGDPSFLIAANQDPLGNPDTIAFSPDGTMFSTLAGGTGSSFGPRKTRVWDTHKGVVIPYQEADWQTLPDELLSHLKPLLAKFDSQKIGRIAFSADGEWFITLMEYSYYVSILRVLETTNWNLVGEQQIEYRDSRWTLPPPEQQRDEVDNFLRSFWDRSPIRRVSQGRWVWNLSSADGDLIAEIGDGEMYIMDTNSSKQLGHFGGETAWIADAEFSPRNTFITTTPGTEDGTVHLWSLDTGRLLQTLSGHTDRVICMAFSPDKKLLATGSADRTIRLWNVRNGTLLAVLEGHTAPVRDLEFSPDGLLLASGSDDGTVIIWGLPEIEKSP